jgi:hypothetical protein
MGADEGDHDIGCSDVLLDGEWEVGPALDGVHVVEDTAIPERCRENVPQATGKVAIVRAPVGQEDLRQGDSDPPDGSISATTVHVIGHKREA